MGESTQTWKTLRKKKIVLTANIIPFPVSLQFFQRDCFSFLLCFQKILSDSLLEVIEDDNYWRMTEEVRYWGFELLWLLLLKTSNAHTEGERKKEQQRLKMQFLFLAHSANLTVKDRHSIWSPQPLGSLLNANMPRTVLLAAFLTGEELTAVSQK